jgi:hypothetical protein
MQRFAMLHGRFQLFMVLISSSHQKLQGKQWLAHLLTGFNPFIIENKLVAF